MDRASNIRTDGVITLRPLDLQDVDEHLAGEDSELVKWLNGGPGTRETVQRHIRSASEQWARGGPKFSYAITSAARSTLMGTIDLDLEPQFVDPGQANLAYGLYPQWRHQGYATRAVELAVQILTAYPSIDEAVIMTSPANPSSRAVAERAGFRWVGARQTDDFSEIMDFLARDTTA